MLDLSNLYANMTAICEHAALHELEIMLRVLRNRLEHLHPVVGHKLTEGLELLDVEIHERSRRPHPLKCLTAGCLLNRGHGGPHDVFRG